MNSHQRRKLRRVRNRLGLPSLRVTEHANGSAEIVATWPAPVRPFRVDFPHVIDGLRCQP